MVCSLEKVFLEGERVGVVAANGIRVGCNLVADDRPRGGRRADGRDEGGWFSASDDWGVAAGVISVAVGGIAGLPMDGGSGDGAFSGVAALAAPFLPFATFAGDFASLDARRA